MGDAAAPYENKGDLGVFAAKLDVTEGVIIVPFASSWADRHGVHRVVMDKASVDVVCAYCPDTRGCYYIDPRRHGTSVALRLAPTRNQQSKRVLLADDFTEFPETP